MLLDKFLEFSNSQTVTTTAVSTNDIDLGPLSGGNTQRDIGAGEELYLNVAVTEGVTAAGAATVSFQLLTDDNTGFSSSAIVFDSGAIGKAALSLGTILSFKLPAGNYERYLRGNYVVATGPLTAGKFSTYISHAGVDRRSYAVGTPILAG